MSDRANFEKIIITLNYFCMKYLSHIENCKRKVGKTHKLRYKDSNNNSGSVSFRSKLEAGKEKKALLDMNKLPVSFQLPIDHLILFSQLSRISVEVGLSIEKIVDIAKVGIGEHLGKLSTTQISLKKAVEEFIEDCKNRNLRSITIEHYRIDLNRLIKSIGENTPVSEIGFEKYKQHFATNHFNSSHMLKITIFLSYLARKEYVKEELCLKLRRFKNEYKGAIKVKEPPCVLSVEKTKALFAEAPQELIAGLALLAFAGVRPHELKARLFDENKKALTWQCIDFANRKIIIPGVTAKCRRVRILEDLPENLWAFLETVPKENRTGDIIPCSFCSLRHKMSKLKTKLPRDVLRHSFASYGYHHLDPKHVLEIMGHIRGYGVFEKHYKGISNKTDAKEYFNIYPKVKENS